MKYLMLLTMVVFLISGCAKVSEIAPAGISKPAPSETVPADLKIEYEWGACYRDEGYNLLSMASNGNVDLKVFEQRFLPKASEYSFTNEEVLAIYDEILKNNFFELEKSYSNPNVLEGGCSELYVKAQGKEHRVSIANMKIEGFDKISNKILEILESKDPDWERVDKALMCSNAKKACETEEKFQEIACDIWEGACERI